MEWSRRWNSCSTVNQAPPAVSNSATECVARTWTRVHCVALTRTWSSELCKRETGITWQCQLCMQCTVSFTCRWWVGGVVPGWAWNCGGVVKRGTGTRLGVLWDCRPSIEGGVAGNIPICSRLIPNWADSFCSYSGSDWLFMIQAARRRLQCSVRKFENWAGIMKELGIVDTV